MCGDDPVSSLTCAHEGTCVHSITTGAFACSCQPQWAGIDCSGMRCSEPEITCYNQVDFDSHICTTRGCDCLNDGYGADCRGVRCGLEPGRCYNGATCIDGLHGICSSCPPGVSGNDCSKSNIIFSSFPNFTFLDLKFQWIVLVLRVVIVLMVVFVLTIKLVYAVFEVNGLVLIVLKVSL
jgi:hypothetical protein